ncbi:hypothetical protein AB1K09_03205 [Solibacillus silvestris]
MLRSIPYIVDGDWLEARLEDPNLRLIDASTFLKILKEKDFQSYGPVSKLTGKSIFLERLMLIY